jgi:hypothetical protein
VDTTAPFAPILISPANTSFVSNFRPDFVWHPSTDLVSGITNYRIMVASNAAGNVKQTYLTASSAETNWTAALGLGDGVWLWKVMAFDKAGMSNASVQWQVSIDRTKPGAVSLSGPTNGTLIKTDTFVLDWSDALDTGAGSSGVLYYQVEIAKGASITTVQVTNTSILTQGIVNQGTNTWRVRAVDYTGNIGAWSATNWFEYKLELYIKRMVPPVNGYATVAEMSNIRVEFSRALDGATVNVANVRVYRWNKASASFVAETVVPNSTSATLWVSLPNISRSNDILATYRIEIDGVTSGGAPLMANPTDPINYPSPFASENKAMVSRIEGGRVGSHLTGIILASDAELRIAAGLLRTDSYVRLLNAPESIAAVRSANQKARRNKYWELVDGFVSKDLKGTGRSGQDLTDLGTAVLEFDISAYQLGTGEVQGEEGPIAETGLAVYRLNESDQRWEFAGTPTVNSGTGKLTLTVTRYGIYTVIGDHTPVGLDESFVVYPNPFDPNNEKARIRYRLDRAGEVSATVFTVTGERVAEIAKSKRSVAGGVDEEIEWDGRNGQGMVVVSGVYLIKATVKYDDGKSDLKFWKVMVAK